MTEKRKDEYSPDEIAARMLRGPEACAHHAAPDTEAEAEETREAS